MYGFCLGRIMLFLDIKNFTTRYLLQKHYLSNIIIANFHKY